MGLHRHQRGQLSLHLDTLEELTYPEDLPTEEERKIWRAAAVDDAIEQIKSFFESREGVVMTEVVWLRRVSPLPLRRALSSYSLALLLRSSLMPTAASRSKMNSVLSPPALSLPPLIWSTTRPQTG